MFSFFTKSYRQKRRVDKVFASVMDDSKYILQLTTDLYNWEIQLPAFTREVKTFLKCVLKHQPLASNDELEWICHRFISLRFNKRGQYLYKHKFPEEWLILLMTMAKTQNTINTIKELKCELETEIREGGLNDNT